MAMHKLDLRKGLWALALCLTAEPALSYSGEVFRVCGLSPDGDDYLSLRECGDQACDEIMRLGPGVFMWTLEPSAFGGWRKVVPMRTNADMFTANPDVGYVYTGHICKVR